MTCDRSVVFSGTTVSSNNKTVFHNITEILLKVHKPQTSWMHCKMKVYLPLYRKVLVRFGCKFEHWALLNLFLQLFRPFLIYGPHKTTYCLSKEVFSYDFINFVRFQIANFSDAHVWWKLVHFVNEAIKLSKHKIVNFVLGLWRNNLAKCSHLWFPIHTLNVYFS